MRASVPDDRAFLLQLYASTREDELNLTHWLPSQKAAFLQMQFRCQTEDYLQRFPTGEFLIVQQNGIDVGRLTLNRSEREIRIVDLIIRPEYRGRGFGTELLQRVLEEARVTKRTVRLHALKYERAVKLYERLGFSVLNENGIYQEMEWSRPSV